MNSKGNPKNVCYECRKIVSGNKKIECTECGEISCKDHIKLNESDHSATCLDCFKKKIHLEVTLEMESESLEAKSQLESLKTKLKNSKKDLARKKTTKEHQENQIKINEKTYQRKFETLSRKIEEETNRGENLENTLKSLELTLEDSKTGENHCKAQVEDKEKEYEEVLLELETLKKGNKVLKYDIQVASEKSQKFISYSQLRNTLCETCKNKIKLCFRDDIINGNRGRESLIQSVLAERIKFHQKQSELPKNDEKAKPCCIIF